MNHAHNLRNYLEVRTLHHFSW